MLLAIEAGVNEPQSPAGAQENFTPAFLLSLATSAAMPAYAPVSIDEGGAKLESKVTAIAGGWYLESPQATSVAAIPTAIAAVAIAIRRRFDRKKAMKCFDAIRKREV